MPYATEQTFVSGTPSNGVPRSSESRLLSTLGATTAVPALRRCGRTHDKTGHTTRRPPRNACPQTRRPEPCTGESASSSGLNTHKYLSSANEPRLSSHHSTRAGLYVDVRCLREPAPGDHRQELRHQRAVTFLSLKYLVSAINQNVGPATGFGIPIPTALRNRALIRRQLEKHLRGSTFTGADGAVHVAHPTRGRFGPRPMDRPDR